MPSELSRNGLRPKKTLKGYVPCFSFRSTSVARSDDSNCWQPSCGHCCRARTLAQRLNLLVFPRVGRGEEVGREQQKRVDLVKFQYRECA